MKEYVSVPATDGELEWLAFYYNGKDPDSVAISTLVKAIQDKREGLGMIWADTAANIDEIKKQLAHHPSSSMTGTVCDALLKTVEEMEKDNA